MVAALKVLARLGEEPVGLGLVARPQRLPGLDRGLRGGRVSVPGPEGKELVDPVAPRRGLDLFGKPQRMEACECERDNNSNMLQALHFINGGAILGRVSNANGRVATLLKQKLDDDKLIEELYLWSLARRPSEKELAVSRGYLASYGEQKTEAAQDLMWALLNSKDFMLVQ